MRKRSRVVSSHMSPMSRLWGLGAYAREQGRSGKMEMAAS